MKPILSDELLDYIAADYLKNEPCGYSFGDWLYCELFLMETILKASRGKLKI